MSLGVVQVDRAHQLLLELREALGLPKDFWGHLAIPYQGGHPSTVKVEVSVKLTHSGTPEHREPTRHLGDLPCKNSVPSVPR